MDEKYPWTKKEKTLKDDTREEVKRNVILLVIKDVNRRYLFLLLRRRCFSFFMPLYTSNRDFISTR